MDYLDPVKKRSHAIRLYIGYGLFTIVIAIVTVILVLIGNGWYVDRNTGDLIQNGQLIINSDPDGATIYLNGHQERPKTAGRLVVPSGAYAVTLKRDGYRDWQTNVTLDGGVIERLDYARLIPQNLSPAVIQTFASTPYALSQSNDRRYLTLQFTDKPLTFFIMDLTQPDATPKEITLTAAQFSDQKQIGTLSIGEWADDNKHFVAKNVVDNVVKDYFVVNRAAPEETVNITKELRLAAGTELSLRDLAYDQYYVYDPALKTLDTINLDGKAAVNKPKNVLAYRTFGSDMVLYVTTDGASSTSKVQARLASGDKTYLMRELAVSSTYLLALAKQGSSPVVAVGAPSENKVTVLRNPVGYLQNHTDQTVPMATTVLQVTAPSDVSFSTDGTAVMARGGQNVATHNFDEDRSAKFVLTVPVSAEKLYWVDGKHLKIASGGFAYIVDYNGDNLQKLNPTLDSLSSYYDNNYQALFTFTSGANGRPFLVSRSALKP